MRIAVIGSKSLSLDIEEFIPQDMTELISGGQFGIDSLAEMYADKHNISKLIIKADVKTDGRDAQYLAADTIVDISEMVVVIWDGRSRRTRHIMDYAKKTGKPVRLHIVSHAGIMNEGNVSSDR